MGRWIYLLIVLLALSAVLSAAIAWACVLMHDTIEFNGIRLGQLRAAEWGGHGAERCNDEPEVWLQHSFTGRGVEIIRLRERPGEKSLSPTPAPGDVQVTIFRAGWPMPAMEGRVRVVQGNTANDPEFVYALSTNSDVSLEFTPTYRNFDGTTPPTRPPIVTKAALPLRPLSPGFAVNTLLFAGVVVLVWMAARTVRFLIRFLRGQCTGCGYPIGVSPQCSECGRAVRPRSALPAR